MNFRRRLRTGKIRAFRLAAVSLLLLAGSMPQGGQAAPSGSIVQSTVRADAINVRYLRAGNGPTTVVLLHGWPESSAESRKVIPLLAKRYTVIAPDLRGVGGTDAPANGYDKATLAKDLHALVLAIKPQQLVVVGHDIGGQVAYSYARLYPEEAKGVAILDVPIPGTSTWALTERDPRGFHFGLNAQKPLAEQLVTGRQALYFRYFINELAMTPSAISDADFAEFAKAYGTPARLTAGFEFYRAFPQDKVANAAATQPLDVPVLLAGGEKSMSPLLPMLERDLRGWGVRNIKTVTIPRSGHWIAEENPDATAAVITDFVECLK